jgi:signal recognition particle subunit SRP54
VTSSVQVLDACLKEITTALLQADVNVKLVMNLRTNVKTRALNADKGAGLNKRKIIEKVGILVMCTLSVRQQRLHLPL